MLPQMGGGSFSLSFGETAALPTALAEPLAAPADAAGAGAAVVIAAQPLAELPSDKASARAREGERERVARNARARVRKAGAKLRPPRLSPLLSRPPFLYSLSPSPRRAGRTRARARRASGA